ncbi:MAG: hypothetical protein ABJF27_04180 [Crocinitomicaceae bacterium]
MKSDTYYKYFLNGFIIKVFGGVVFALIYVYYYGFGDTFLYHNGASVLSQTLVESPADYLSLLGSEGGNLPPELSPFADKIKYSRTYEEWFMVKILSPINLVSFQSYLVTTLFMSLISFIGGWKLFQVLRDILPEKEKYAFWAVFLIPSVVFWGGGIMKDTITLFCINYVIYLLYFSLFKKKFKPFYFVGILFFSYLIISLKAYIILAFLPGAFLGIYVLFSQSMKSKLIKYVVGPFVFMGLIGASFFSLNLVGEGSEKYQASNLEWKVKGFHSWHTDVGGSSYNLGEIEYTAAGVSRKIPAALNVTFFRPYLWEARNPVVFIGALESFLFFAIFIYVMFKFKFRIIREIRKYPILYGMFIYCLIFGFAVGFTSYNFGALARYKIPILSLFGFIMFLLMYKARTKAQSHKTELSDQPYDLENNTSSAY